MEVTEEFLVPGSGQEDEVEREGSPGISRRFSLGSLGRRVARVGETLARTAAAAGELIADSELRTRSAAFLAEGVSKAAAGVGKGLQQGAGRIAAGPRTVQGILQKLQQRIEEQRLQALLQEQQDAPVDVQVAFQLYEDAPQELRSRLWMAVLEHPELCKEYQTLAAALQQPVVLDSDGEVPRCRQTATDVGASAGAANMTNSPSSQAAANSAQTPAGSSEGTGINALRQPVPQLDGDGGQPAAAELEHPTISESLHVGADPAHLSSYSAPWAMRGGSSGSSSSPRGQPMHLRQDDDGWQMVNDQAGAHRLQGQALLAGAGQQAAYCRQREGFRNILMTAMMSIPWPLPSSYPPDCRYATLLQISLGQEEIEEVISRDIHRTFPEYPLFAFEQGQQALFNVLKSYALHDMEASYCQGMAFVAGLLLFYVPEEPAFQLFCRLLSTSGPNLRRLYLPGLEGLKWELRKLDFLLQRFLPNLTAHLNEAGVVPVLFASQWLLTCYSCPFPVGFACRLLDVMLQENSDAILLKAAVTILAECEGDLLMQEDFEALLTYLKVEPVQWSPQRLRRVLNAAISSPITAQDLADAEAALQLGFTGSLSRVPTYSTEAEVAGAEEGLMEAPLEQSAVAANSPGRQTQHTRNTSITSQPATSSTQGGEAVDDVVTAELAAAQQQIDEELMNMVLGLDLAWGAHGGEVAAESYSNTLHSAVKMEAGSQSNLLL